MNRLMSNDRKLTKRFLALLLAFVMTHLFSTPISNLTQKAQLMAEGDYNMEFPQEGAYEIRRLSQTLSLAAAEFRTTEQMRREFVANISHDMRTPLTVIKMYAEMIQTVSGDNPQKREEHLQRIQKEAERLSSMIDDTMDLAKLQSGALEIKRKNFDLTHLIESAISSSYIRFNEKNIKIETDIDSHLQVNADRKLISRALQNYISNAIKFSYDNQSIIVRAYEKDGEAYVEVQDFGPGISPEDIPNVWTRYYTVDPYGNNRYGTGLGLNIVAEIMKKHDFQYGVNSELSKGSTFWFTLKMVEE